MRVILDLDEDILNKADIAAKSEGRSRKKYMERLIIDNVGHNTIFVQPAFGVTAVKKGLSAKTSSNSLQEPCPVKREGEDALEFAARKNEWKRNMKK